MRKMGGLRKYMPVTYVTCLIGSLALIGFPGTAGFFSKDALIEAVELSTLPGARYAYWCVFLGVFITAFYSFRLVFMTFHGPERFAQAGAHDPAHGHEHAGHAVEGHEAHATAHGDAAHAHDSHARDAHGHHHGPITPQESPWVVTLPLILLAIPSLIIGWLTIGPVLFGNYFGDAIVVREEHDVLGEMAKEFTGPAAFILHALAHPPVYLALVGVAAAWFLYIKRPDLPQKIAAKLAVLYRLLIGKFYFDELYQAVFASGSRGLGKALWQVGDVALIDGAMVNGSARVVGWLAGVVRRVQSGYLYHYAFAMILGLSALLAWYVLR
jgi:NADH-quinone oxidoreductase subunit L